MLRMNFPGRKEERRKKAARLAEERAKRSPQQQLDHLDRLLGKDQGAKRERARLLKAINKDDK